MRVVADDPLLAECAGAVFIVRVEAEAIFPNCPRDFHRRHTVQLSACAPRPDCEPPVQPCKAFDASRDALPPRDRGEDGHG